jgi:hypothetical protein
MLCSRTSRPVTRILAIFLATLLSFTITSDAFGFDPCPHHGVPVRAAHAGMSHHQSPPNPHASHHDDAPPSHHDDAPRSHHDAQHGVCTCLGACNATAAVPVPSAPEINAIVTQAPVSRSHLTTTDAPASLSLQLQPYGIAPPAPTGIR